jgi:WD40 repeat protein
MRGVESSAQGGGVEEAREAQEAQGRVSGTRAGWSGQSTSGQSSPPRDGEGLSKPHHRRKTSISSLVASLFSVPPQKKLPGMTGGIYAVDGVHVDDEGRVMGMDPKYWIKDIDTGNVYSLEDNRGLDERGVGAAGASQTSASTSAAQGGTSGATSGAAGGAGGDGAALGTLHTAPTKKSTRPMGPMEQGIARASAEGIRSSARAPASVLATAGTRGPPSKGSGAIRVSDVFTTDGSNFDDSSKKTSRDLNQFEEALGYRRTADELGSKLAVQKQKGAHLPTLEDRAVSNSMLSRAGAKWWFTAVNAVKRELNLGHAQGHPQVVSDGNLVDSGIPGLCPSPSSPGSDGFGGPSKGQHGLRVKVVTSRKNFKEFSGLRLIQSVYAHEGVIWVAKFSPNGKFLATAGQDGTVTVWKTRTNRSLVAEDDVEKSNLDNSNKDNRDSDGAESVGPVNDNSDDDAAERPSVSYGSVPVLDPTPYRRYKGHKKDVLDLSWSSSNFLFSASMDKTVRLWHVSVDECLKIFRHNDFVTSIAVHPLNEALFLSGSIDGKVRLWNVPNATVNSWVDIHDMVTALNFNTDGSKAVVGSMRGKCRFYTLGTNNLLEYEASLDVKNKHGHNSRGRKITGLTYAPNKMLPNALLCTSNDSRVRLYDGYTLRFKYKGLSNKSTQVRQSF